MHPLILDNLGKRYDVEAAAESPPGTFRERLARWRDLLLFRRGLRPAKKEFWAVRNVSLTVEPGTILGIIGPNGAGKTTLLKILARVTPPTEGRATGHGRVVSLLEMNAGFNPESSARENILMNAALHGISKAEALARTRDILEWAELEEFADQPLKHYSSGMAVRLGFSVAINMNPQVLLADEVLAVGDMAFQERCMQAVIESGKRGLIVLFVSHDMEAIERVCNRVLWLHKGQVQKVGSPDEVVADYEDAVWAHFDAGAFERGRRSSRFAAIRGAKLLSSAGREIGAANVTEDVFIAIEIEAFKAVAVRGAVDLNARNQLVFRCEDADFRRVTAGFYQVRLRIPANLLSDISYTATVSVTTLREGQTREYRLIAYNALTFMAFHPEREARVAVKGKLGKTGLMAPKLEWSIEEHHVAV
ncbi:MAG: ATP-binding cassette domain-containing protein [Acidimicrobiia bacterium]|nr:ATP-binding cassette domain-containing protein [Acidimicrobiia bacterium]